MENLSRGKKMLAMLNKDLRDRFTNENKQKRKKNYDDFDSDYQPESESDSDSSPNKETTQVVEVEVHSYPKDVHSYPKSLSLPLQAKNVLPVASQAENAIAIQCCSQDKLQNSEAVTSQDNISLSQSSSQEDNSLLIVSPLIEQLIDLTMSEVSKKITKRGTVRKRQKFDTPLSVRIATKKMKKILKHEVKPCCSPQCFLKCSSKFDEEQRNAINKQYWESIKEVQNNFLLNHVKRVPIKRRTVVVSAESLRKSTSFNYFLKDDTGESHRVCKLYFLGTLGYDSHDDRFLRSIISSENEGAAIYKPKSRTRVITPNKKIDRTIIVEHINSFRPTISHYRRAHAPNRRYLPSDINISYMHKHFEENHPDLKVSYQIYRQAVAEENISFVKLGHEECWSCEVFELHCKQMGHSKENLLDECDVCKKWNTHIQRAKLSREIYQQDGESDSDSIHLIVSADLQKV